MDKNNIFILPVQPIKPINSTQSTQPVHNTKDNKCTYICENDGGGLWYNFYRGKSLEWLSNVNLYTLSQGINLYVEIRSILFKNNESIFDQDDIEIENIFYTYCYDGKHDIVEIRKFIRHILNIPLKPGESDEDEDSDIEDMDNIRDIVSIYITEIVTLLSSGFYNKAHEELFEGDYGDNNVRKNNYNLIKKLKHHIKRKEITTIINGPFNSYNQPILGAIFNKYIKHNKYAKYNRQ